MSEVLLKVEFEEVVNAVRNFSEEEKDKLFFELNPIWGEALKKMETEALKEDDQEKTIPLKDLK